VEHPTDLTPSKKRCLRPSTLLSHTRLQGLPDLISILASEPEDVPADSHSLT
jgi:hypothetical protein